MRLGEGLRVDISARMSNTVSLQRGSHGVLLTMWRELVEAARGMGREINSLWCQRMSPLDNLQTRA